MKYISTRSTQTPLSFDDVLLGGLAADGGLYVPLQWPQLSEIDLRDLRGKPYSDVALRVMAPFTAGCITEGELKAIIDKAYASFHHQAVVPLVQLDSQLWLMELFHGPTLAFKDVALQLLGHLFDHVLQKKNQRLTIVGATSGDTGSAAIEGCRGRDNLDIFILHPQGRVSEVQRKQMTTVSDANVYNLAIDGTFDDCQDIVKRLFNDPEMKRSLNLGAINSINWARLMAQIVYYIYSAVNLGAPDRAMAFAVPTGNFGNIFAAYGAHQMGLPIERLICASNSNDILTRFYQTGFMQKEPVVPTLAPSMDIQISSNFERLLFDLVNRRAGDVVHSFTQFSETGSYSLSPERHAAFTKLFAAHSASDEEILHTISRIHRSTGLLIDPHTATGLAAVAHGNYDKDLPVISLACAHPAKFPEAVFRATGEKPVLPAEVARKMSLPERVISMPKDYHKVAQFIRSQARSSKN